MAELDTTRTPPTAPLEWEYAPAPESRDVVRFAERYGLFVGGELVDPRSGSWYTTIEPATEEIGRAHV